ncbi:hypothetical protein BKA67DRAFT_654827 [Truncatella angustata]|uniref:Uncharacterized protein n=1 Tax=Truncatella angustata TaxID=152316 RepID=A0A9P8UR34_9PEZI|nr:uncharacterized protein BKA67DRAFT_654827 [Truncatella angustata]KAH6656490.1 hypothetical protein BKA67DRAFT_654827 [Truncatella angustata]KAH8200003.1 hypothetical protein TruAng_005830 [Truncatella angustata]
MPVETMPDAPAPETKPRRRFAPQLVEETVKSSKDTKGQASQEPQGALEAPEPETTKPRRRFAPQLVEETVKSSKDKNEPTAPDPRDGSATGETPPRRRFAPQLVEKTVKSSNAGNQASLSTRDGGASENRTTKDASVQVDDIEMKDAPSSQARRRFAPVPIETTFDSYRVNKNPHGPTAELTPDPSPTDSLPPLPSLPSAPVIETIKTSDQKPKRRFAPQLIETSRRAKRAGQDGPATKPTDKTDITPGTNHIYVSKPKRKPQQSGTARTPSIGASGETGSESPRFSLLNPRRQQSMKPHPNTRRGTRTNSFAPELEVIPSSESDKSEDDDENGESRVPAFSIGAPARAPSEGATWATRNPDAKDRRESCDDNSNHYLLAVAAREAFRQRELEQAMSAYPNGLQPQNVEHFVVRDNSGDDVTYEEEPLRHGTSKLIRRKSTDLNWAVSEMRQHAEKMAALKVKERDMSIDEDLDEMDIAPPPEDPLWTTAGPRQPSRNQLNELAQSPWQSPFLIASSPRVVATSHAPSPRTQPETTGFKSGPFGNPFAAYNQGKEESLLRRTRKSPPMLGMELKFRMCPSPKATRLEPDHPWPIYGDASRPEEKQRDASGETGLWRGYCVASGDEDMIPSTFQQPELLATPAEPANSTDPFSMAFASTIGSGGETPRTPASPTRRDQPKGLHLLSGLDERLKKEMVRKEKQARLLAEFDDAFVTQVYNYVSLGYPAMARQFDEELSKISGLPIRELQKDDDKKIEKGFMLDMELKIKESNNYGSDEEMKTPEEDEKKNNKPPRWAALRLYIREWARQHPYLGDDEGNQLAWGVRARRGSWAI